MFPDQNQEELKRILNRIAQGIPLSLKERIYIQNIAINNEKISSWLKRASRIQQGAIGDNEIDQLMHSLDLGFSDPQSVFNPETEDIGDWFMGAPKWLSRS